MHIVETCHCEPSAGSAGVKCHISGASTTVSNIAGAAGGIKSGNMIECDIK